MTQNGFYSVVRYLPSKDDSNHGASEEEALAYAREEE
jgi:hypothetical protein